MAVNRKEILLTLIATSLFYVVGRLLYERFYELTLSLITRLSKERVHFFGKFPFWFVGDPYFGLIACSIPTTIALCHALLKATYLNAFKRTLFLYLLMLSASYLLNCYVESITLISSNDFYKGGKTLLYNLNQVNINSILFEIIITATVLTATVNTILRFRVIRNVSLQ